MRLEGVDEPVVNSDSTDVVERLASRATSAGVLAALRAVDQANDDLAHNVSPQLVFETMLCTCKEALCPPSFR